MKNIIIRSALLGIFCALLMNSCAHQPREAALSNEPNPLPEAPLLADSKTPLKVEEPTPATAKSTPPSQTPVYEAVKIPNYKELLKTHFPSANKFEDIDFLPLKNGGTSFTGLVTRLLGTGLNRPLEGLRTRRYYYLAYENHKPVGVAHGSSSIVRSNTIDTFVVYSAGGTVKEVRVAGLPQKVLAQLEKGDYLKQFEEHATEDFEVTLGRRGRIRSRGIIFKKLRYPRSAEARMYFEKIFRSIRFNTAFMDVAFFITQHPDLADKTSADGETEEISQATISPLSPETFVKDKVPSSPIDGR